MPNPVKGFRYVQKNTSYFKRGIGVKRFVDFVLLRAPAAHMNHRAESLTEYKYGVYYHLNG